MNDAHRPPPRRAVALKHDRDGISAPRVTARGEMLFADQILEIARQHKIPIMRDVALANALSALEIGQEIPEDLFAAVAEILHWVYDLRAEEPGLEPPPDDIA